MSEEASNKQWAVKYRPITIDDVVGNDSAKQNVLSQIETNDAHCILFTGPSGCGKTTLAMILAKHLSKGVKADVEWINAASDGQIEKIRELVKRAEYFPRKGKRVIIVDEAHALTGASKSALLIPTETPPHDKLVWIFCTNKSHLLDGELLNRCLKIVVQKPSMEEIFPLLRSVVKEEKAFRKMEKDEVKKILKEVAKAADFVPREALQILQEAAKGGGEVKQIVGRIRNGESASVDKAALQVIMALCSSGKSLEFRAKYLVQQAATQDAYVLLNRLTAVAYNMLLDINGVKVPAAFYYHKELDKMGGYPSDQQATVISCRLADLKLKLTQVNIDPAHLIIPELLHLQDTLHKYMDEKDD